MKPFYIRDLANLENAGWLRPDNYRFGGTKGERMPPQGALAWKHTVAQVTRSIWGDRMKTYAPSITLGSPLPEGRYTVSGVDFGYGDESSVVMLSVDEKGVHTVIPESPVPEFRKLNELLDKNPIGGMKRKKSK